MPAVAERLPWTLRAYRSLASLATPLAGIVLARRQKRGKENPARLAEREIAVASLRQLRRSGGPALRLPAFGGILHEGGRSDRDDPVRDSQICERLQHSRSLHQPSGGRRRDQGSGSESGHGNSRDEPAAVREPLHQNGNRDDIAHA